MQSDVTIEDFVEKYVKAISMRLRSYRQIHRHLRRFEKYFAGQQLDSIHRRDISKYIEHRQSQGIDPSSINIELAVLSASINYAKRQWEFEIPNPVQGQYFPSKPGRLRYLERHEAEQLLESARKIRSPCLPDFIELALNTGARKNELLQLQFKSIDFQRQILTIEAHTTKTGKRRYLPINQIAHETLLRRLAYRNTNCPESPWVFSKRHGGRVRTLDKSFQLAVKRTGLQDFSIHDLRHTFASWLVSEGVELVKVRDLLGHSSISMTERYAHLAPCRLHEAVSVLDRYRGQKSLDLS